MPIIKSIVIFVLAGFCEIGGGYLVWLWLREGKPVWIGLSGGLILALYGAVATLQTSNFAKTYAASGGFFIVLSLLWACKFDKYSPTRYDIAGALIALLGVLYYLLFAQALIKNKTNFLRWMLKRRDKKCGNMVFAKGWLRKKIFTTS